MRRPSIMIAACLLTLSAAPAALAGAHPPARAIPASFYSGKWYEIARTPNAGQRDCQAPSTEFTGASASGFSVHQICHKGSATGAAKTFDTKGKIIGGSENTRFSMSFLGGLQKQEYWILDCAEDHGWAIMATPGGNYVWLLSRQPQMSAEVKAQALARVKALGYAKLEYPQHPGS